MNVSKKSWHYWLYIHVWSDIEPKDICSYIRKLILTLIIFIPMTAFFLPYILFELIFSFVKKKNFEYPLYYFDVIKAFLAALVALCIYPMIAMWFYLPKSYYIFVNNPSPIFQAGLLVWCLVLLLVLVFVGALIEKRIKRARKPKVKKPKQPSIFIEAYKSFKEKHCKRINWVD